MKSCFPLVLIGLFAGVLSITPAFAELRDFTDIRGNTKRFELVSHDGSGATVNLRTEAGKELTGASLSSFSEADQKFIREWMKKNPPKVSYNFRFDAKRDRVGGEKKENRKVSEYAYEVEIVNQARVALTGLVVRYQILTNYEASSDWRGDQEFQGFVGGEYKVADTVKSSGKIEFTTDAASVASSERTQRFGIWRSDSETKGEVKGIHIRVYDASGAVAGEYRSDGFKDRKWVEEPKPHPEDENRLEELRAKMKKRAIKGGAE